jgi:hypothetical protein
MTATFILGVETHIGFVPNLFHSTKLVNVIVDRFNLIFLAEPINSCSIGPNTSTQHFNYPSISIMKPCSAGEVSHWQGFCRDCWTHFVVGLDLFSATAPCNTYPERMEHERCNFPRLCNLALVAWLSFTLTAIYCSALLARQISPDNGGNRLSPSNNWGHCKIINWWDSKEVLQCFHEFRISSI